MTKFSRFVARNGVWAVLLSLAAVTTVRANHVAFYGIGKEHVYEQSSDATVAPASSGGFGFTGFAVPTSADSIVLVTVTPSGSSMPQFLDSITGGFVLDSTFDTQADLDSNFPTGAYTFDAMSTDFSTTEGPATLTLSGDAYPNTPQVANFTAAQAVAATNDFVVNWNALANATADDYVQFTLTDDDSGDIVFNSGFPGQAGALPGTARSVTIAANTLTDGSTYTAALTFGHITSRDQTDYPGGVGVTTFTQQTRFSLKTTGSSSGGGIPSGTPPVLLFVNPANNATGVPVNSSIVFMFTAPMKPVQAITWSANVTGGTFSYTWGPTGTNLTAKYSTDFPANAKVTWALDPTVFQGQDGTALLAFNNSGSFTTGSAGSSTNNPCNGGNTGLGSISLLKSIQYVQTSSSAPVIDGTNGAMFGAVVSSPVTNPVTQVQFDFNGTTKQLTGVTNIFTGQRSFFYSDTFATEAALDTAYPAGTYTFTIVRTTGTATIGVNLPAANAAPPIPQISNFAQAMAFDPTADYTVQWLPFTGAAANDAIAFDLNDSHGTDYHAPDPCIPRELLNTATSITVPKNTFGAGGTMEGSLTFEKITTLDTNSVPSMAAFAGFAKITRFNPQSGGTSTQPQLLNVVRQANGTVQFQVKGAAGATFTVQASSDLKAWVPLTVQPSATGLLDVSDPQAAGMPYRFYRASTP